MPAISPLALAGLNSSPQLAVLQPGAVIQALVLALIDDATLRLQLPAGTLDVASDIPLAPGTRVQLAVTGSQAEPQILLTPLPDRVPATSTSLPPLTPIANPPIQNPAPTSLQGVIAQVLREAVTQQGGLAPLLADLHALVTQSNVTLPPDVRAAATQLLALRLDASETVSAADIKTALTHSGLLPPAGESNTSAAPEIPDLRVALAALRQSVKAWADTPPQTNVLTKLAVPTLAALQSSYPPSAKSVDGQAVVQSSAPAASRAQIPPPPPHRNAATSAQPPALTTFTVDSAPRDIATHLLQETDAALARHTLLQIASLPDDSSGANMRIDHAASRIVFDIPLATAQGFGVAQFRIEQDGAQRHAELAKPVWRASFSIDLEPVGPVHARIALCGERATVTIFAERDDSAIHLRENLPVLEASLKDAALEPGDMQCRQGGAPSLPTAPGLFVNRAS